MSKQPYPWPRSIMLRRRDAPLVYEIEANLKNEFRDLEEALEEHVEGDKWTHIIPYMLFCTLEGYDTETSIAACLGYLRHVLEGDLQHEVVRESLKGLVLPKEPE